MNQQQNRSVTYWHEVASIIGPLLLTGTDAALTGLYFQGGPRPVRPQEHWVQRAGPLAAAVQQLEEYFSGRRQVFDLPLAPAGTAFQLAVWRALQGIGYGRTMSYGQLARELGHARGARAVGLANGSNPLPVIIPCHRVIGADGSLTGFGGGLEIKRALLQLEGAACVTDLFSMRVSAAGSAPARPVRGSEG